MRRLANAVVVAAAAAVAVVAGWDATRPSPPTQAERVEALRTLGASGQILFSDEHCARRRLLLPELRLSEVPRITGCDVFGHRGSLGIVGGEVGWYAYPGGVTTLLTRRGLERETHAPGARVVAAAWLANTRYAALVERPGGPRLLALFEAGRLARTVAELDSGFRELRSSPGGSWFAALGSDGRLALYDAAGDAMPLPYALHRPHAIAWSRDDAVAAAADARGLLLFRAADAAEAPVRLELAARDLAWRG